jgi:cholesterol oxidase
MATGLDTAARLVFTPRRRPGISFTERMSGWWTLRDTDDCPVWWMLRRPDYADAEAAGRHTGMSISLVLTIVADDLDALVRAPEHEAGFTGTAEVVFDRTPSPGRAPVRLRVTDGVFRLFADEPNSGVFSRTMEYSASLTGNGWHGTFRGFKAIRFGGGRRGFGGDESWRAVWRDQTRLFFVLILTGDDGTIRTGLGILEVRAGDLLKQLLTIRPRGTRTLAESLDTVGRFVAFYGGVLRDTYGGPLARSHYAPPNWWDRRRRPLVAYGTLIKPTPYELTAGDGARLALTHYATPLKESKGAVILAAGFGVNPSSFAVDTVPISLVEFLCGAGYDAWLFDYRASPAAEASRADFTLDDIARHDWPAAIDHVWRAGGGRKIRVIAHCVGSLTFLMAAACPRAPLAGRIEHAVCSQVGLHPVSNQLNEWKAALGIGTWMDYILGRRAIRLTMHSGLTFGGRLFNRLLKLLPTDDPCDNPVCRRILFVFGESYRHANLNRATHDVVIEMFGDATTRESSYVGVRALRHLQRIVVARRALDRDRGDEYLPRVHQIDFPVHFVHGGHNTLFSLDGTNETAAYLRTNGVSVTVDVFPDYGHMDCFIGENASKAVFPVLLTRLQGGTPPPQMSSEDQGRS